MPTDQIVMGGGVVVLCAAGLWREQWFLDHTKKGRRLTRWFGARGAVWVLRGMFFCGVVFGCLLATGVVNPVRW